MSTIKNTYNNAEDIPEGLESIYAKTDNGDYAVKVDGMVDKSRLDEFRDNNVNLRKEIEGFENQSSQHSTRIAEMEEAMRAVESKYSGIDLEAYAEQQQAAKALAEKELIEAGEVDKLIDSRVNEVLAAQQKELQAQKMAYEGRLESLQTDLVNYDSQLNVMLVDNELTKIAGNKGVRASALEDVLSRGREVFRVEEGQATAFGTEGRPLYAEDAVTPLSIDGWIGGLTKSAPHLFEMSSGAGAPQPISSSAPAAEPASPLDAILSGLADLK